MDIYQEIKDYKETRNLTHEDLAREFGVCLRTISRWMKNKPISKLAVRAVLEKIKK